jgi:hypothetical protein
MSDTHETKGGFSTLEAAEMLGRQYLPSHVDRWIFVFMLVLAFIGVGVSEVSENSGWMYWSSLVLIYAAISVGRSWVRVKHQGGPLWPMLRAEVLHWLGALIAIKIIIIFEVMGITVRDAAADFALLILALSTFLAGVHFNWISMWLGGILALIAVGIGFLDQLTVYLVIIPVALIAIFFVFRHRTAKTVTVKAL